MNRPRLLGCATRAMLVGLCLSATPRAGAQPDVETQHLRTVAALEAAITLFDDGDFIGAQNALKPINREHLNAAERTRHTEYTQRAAVGASMFEKANTDYEAGIQAVTDERYEDARRLFQSVIENKYGSKETRAAAAVELMSLPLPAPGRPDADAPAEAESDKDAAPQPVPPPAPHGERDGARDADEDAVGDETDQEVAVEEMDEAALRLRSFRAQVLTREAIDAMDAGRLDKAETMFKKALEVVPGYPEAVNGLDRLSDHSLVERAPETLINRIKQRNSIAWQRTVTTYRTAEREVRNHVLDNRFDLASQVLLRGRQVVEGGRAFAEPVSRYEALMHDVQALSRYVEDEGRRHNERAVAEQRAEARKHDAERLKNIRDSREAHIRTLMNQALQHRKDRSYDSAINVLQQVLSIEPTNDSARWMIDALEDQRAYRHQRELRDDFYRQSRTVLEGVEESKIPWAQDMTFPKNWREIISRPTRIQPGSERSRGIDSGLQSKLDRPIRIDFQGDPLHDVIQKLAKGNAANISVAWKDLADAGIPRDTPVNLTLSEPVSFAQALSEVLDIVGDSRVQLGYLPTGNIIKVATRDMLDRNVHEEVYDVRDLLMPVPNFDDAPKMDLKDPATFVMHARGIQSAGSDGRLFDDFEELPEEVITEHANKLVSLIRKTIAPDSWQANNGHVGSITEINGQLVITQTPTGHARVGGLLQKLREQRAVQIAIEARFITVQSNYLEEMGIDLDIILNSGNAGFDFLAGAGGRRLVDPVLGSQLLLPRSFSRFGFTPGTPAVGTGLTAGTANLPQPFNQAGLVPARGNNSLFGSNLTPLPLLNNVLQFTDPGRLSNDLPGSFAGDPTLQPAFSVFGSFLDNIQVDFLVRATQADSRTSLVTAPRLVLFNGQRAWVAVVNQQSFVSSLQPIVDATGQAPDIQTIETGAVLDAQATVSADRRYVTMTLRPSIGRLLGIQTFGFSVGPGGTGSFVQLPSITRTVLRTTVSVPDGGTLLIGGQKLAGEVEVESGVPILSKIPILKRLYSSRTLIKDEQVLLILIKPKIIIQSEAEQIAFPTFGSR